MKYIYISVIILLCIVTLVTFVLLRRKSRKRLRRKWIPIYMDTDASFVSIRGKNGQSTRILLDTGSVYTFIPQDAVGGNTTLQGQYTYTYGLGSVTYGKLRQDLLLVNNNNKPIHTLSDLTFGIIKDKQNFPIDGITGLAQLSTENSGNFQLASTMTQLEYNYISFDFGPNPAILFEPYNDCGKGELVAHIPLLSPLPTPGYGYISSMKSLKVTQTNGDGWILYKDDNNIVNYTVYTNKIITSGKLPLITTWNVFFDTGTTLPIVHVDGNVNLLGSKVSNAILDSNNKIINLSHIQYTFANGMTLSATSSNNDKLEMINQSPDMLNKITKLLTVCGYRFQKQYNVEYSTDMIKFFKRP